MVTWPRCPWLFRTWKFQRLDFSVYAMAERYILYQKCLKSIIVFLKLYAAIRLSSRKCVLLNSVCKVSKKVNRKLPATEQLSTAYTDPERHNAQRYRHTDGQTPTDRRQYHANYGPADHTAWQHDQRKSHGDWWPTTIGLAINYQLQNFDEGVAA